MLDKIIPYDSKFDFCFLEEKDQWVTHPVSDYYLKVRDLSINIDISLKWAFWSHHFFTSISTRIKADEYDIKYILDKSVLESWDFSKKKKHELFFNDILINSKEDLIRDISSDLYKLSIFDENTSVNFKLKLNLDEFIIISSVYFPTYICWDEITEFTSDV